MSGLFGALFDGPGPRWFNIAADRPFAADLARGLTEALAGDGPDALSQAVVLVPTRRGARELTRAFAEAGGGRAMLPPQVLPLGDLDDGEPPFEPGDLALDLPAAIDPMRRRFELMALVRAHADKLDRDDLAPAQALEYAEALGGFFDGLQIEEIEIGARLGDLVTADLATHWQVSQRFLEAALADWPRRLEALGLMDVSQRRAALLRRLAQTWTERPPDGVLVAAGSTGTAPATRALLRAIAAAPRGLVVLPGLDKALDSPAWGEIDDQHPQRALKRLLDDAGVDRAEVADWPGARRPSARLRVVNEALRPAGRTADWLQVIAGMQAPVAEGLAGLSLITARSEDRAADAAALLLREALETPGRTAALITPDQGLGRRVAARLARWGVVPDISMGDALADAPAGVLAGLMARLARAPLDPVALLAVLKHPATRLGLPPEALELGAEVLERHGLRGARPADWAQIRARLDAPAPGKVVPPAAYHVAARLEAVLANLAPALPQDGARLGDAATGLARAMEAAAADAEGDPGELWGGQGGEAVARLLQALIADEAGLGQVTPLGFQDLLSRLLAAETTRAAETTHPRLRILGAIEARLVRADLMILGGLEEGVWPRGPGLDPFLSRPMREALGLPSPERRIGLQAHDFAQAACAPQVVLLHAERRAGAPSVKSRWLWRLETLAAGAGAQLAARDDVPAWADALDEPGAYSPIARPAPTPPVEHRPDKLAVTRIETLTRDPYAVWARNILGLYQLDRPDAPVEASGRGTAIHAAFEAFVRAYPDALPPDAAAIFEALYMKALVDAGVPQEALAREGALARQTGAWVADMEARRRAGGVQLHVELQGALTLDVGGRPFTLTARTDRIEVTHDGRAHVLDYKTGTAPTKPMIQAGFSPQLTLTAAILEGGGFKGLGALEAGDLVYVRVTGRRPPGEELVRLDKPGESRAAIDAARDGVVTLLAKFQDRAYPYLSRRAPQYVHDGGDYDHLARVFEWSTRGEAVE